MPDELGPRLITHSEVQLDYYKERVEQTEKDLARLSLLYSGQLMLDITPSVNS